MASTAAARRSLGYAAARERVLSSVRVLPAETVPLSEARGRALRVAAVAPHPLPPFRNSSMDGYAVRAADLGGASPAAPVELPVVEVIPAGRLASRALGEYQAMRIMTGAEVPRGADAVAPFEDAERVGAGPHERVRLSRPLAPGQNVREAGADLAAGEVALPGGRELSPHDVALLAALGLARVEVGPAPRVSVISTGDELLAANEPLRPGAIRDSNLPLLAGLLEESGCRLIRAGRAPDDENRVFGRIREGLEGADVVITVGGVSAGDFDPVKSGLERLAGAELWRVAMKPGQPQAFGAPEGKLFFGLPGNPGSVACVFEALVRPALRMMQGFSALDRPRLGVRASEPIESRQGRTDFVRAILERRGDEWWARPAGVQVSGHVAPQARAHALLIVPEPTAALAAGDRAEALLLRWPDAARL